MGLIRAYQRKDLERCKQIRVDCARTSMGYTGKKREIMIDFFENSGWEKDLAKPDSYVFEKDGKVLGMIGIYTNEKFPGIGSIERAYVDPEHHKQGIGTRLLHECENGAVDLGLTRIVAFCQPPSVHMFMDEGYNMKNAMRITINKNDQGFDIKAIPEKLEWKLNEWDKKHVDFENQFDGFTEYEVHKPISS